MRSRISLLLVLLMLAGCGGTSGSDAGPGAAASSSNGSQTYRIAVIPKGTTHDFWKSVHAGAMQAAQELGNVEILWKGPPSETDKETQIKIVESYIVERVDGICLAPIDRDALVPVVKRAGRRNIPTVVFDSGLSDEESIVSYVATDNRRGGEIAGDYLAKLLNGEGDVILLRYQAGSESTEQREAGFLSVLKQHPQINILSEDQRVPSDAQRALEISESLLGNFRDRVDGVFTVCEPNNKGMLRALENTQLAGKVKFVGFDSAPRFVEALKQGSMHGIVLQDPVKMGYLAVKTMVAHLKGETVEKRIATGEYLATPENIDDPEIHKLLFPEKFDGE